MARKNSRQATRKDPPAEQFPETKRPAPFRDWALSLLLLISVAPDGPFQTVRVLPLPTDAVLAPDWSWDPPLSHISWIQQLAEWPFWLYASVMSLLIVSVLSRRVASCDVLLRLLLLMAMSLRAQPDELIAVAIVLAVLHLHSRIGSGSRIRFAMVYVIAAVSAILLCLDFSLVLLILFVCVLHRSDKPLSNRQVVTVASIAVMAVAVGAMVSRGFAAAAARPLTWQFVPQSVLPVGSASEDGFLFWLPCFLVVGLVVYGWWQIWNADRKSWAQHLPLVVFSALSFTNHHYQFLSLLGIVCLTDWSRSSDPQRSWERRLRWCCVLVAVLYLLPQMASYRSFVLTGRWPRQFVDPSTWETSGRVMLMKPRSADRWRTGRTQELFDLIIDDRWDVFRGEYRNYLRVCHDLREVRSSRYLRRDGEWGGYKQWTAKWKPTLLVADSSDLDGIRRLSLSPHWKVLGIDSHRTIFGAEGDSRNQQQARAAGRLLSQLEWPGPGFDGSFGNVLAATGDAQRIRVARVLLSIRLPYAALRVMPETPDDHDVLISLCHFELAHRVFRHTRTHSLLDQYRSVFHLRRLAKAGALSAKQIIRVARGLEEMGEPETASVLAGILTQQSFASDSNELESATGLIERCQLRMEQDPAVNSSGPRGSLRRALRAGDAAAVTRELDGLEDHERRFFEVLANAIARSAEDLYVDLIGLLNSPGFPEDLRSEALFYLGSLAIEVGDSASAANAFSASLQAAPTHPLNSISRVSLMNLQRPAN